VSNRRLAALAAVLVAGLALPCSAGAAQRNHLKLGALKLHRCEKGTRWWCGSIVRRLDPAKPHGAHIRIGFRR
jgi:hypothetical protein